ncbi:MAG: Phosphoglucosamine mutase [Verrucomicrobia bacterium ADurb.Bin474]|nr:MAG: Phosphoglucosamine mutase [Verrucomicrobia bacterium ADurb.Bin474]
MINLRLADKIPLDQLSHLKAVQERWTSTLGGRGRLLVRYSGTEAKIRLLAECPDSEQVERALAELSIAARKDLRVLD